MTDAITLQARLTALETAEFELVAGKKATRVSYGGESVEYAASDLSQIRSMMRNLRRQLGLPGGQRAPARAFRTGARQW